MNGEALDANRGFPVRVVFPGIIGARWVKWVNELVVRYDESPNFYQQYDYKQLPPEAQDQQSAKKFWSMTESMMDNPINSVIALPRSGSFVKRDENNMILIKGYALPKGSCGPIVKVEISIDDGKSWMEADLDYGGFDLVDWKSIRWSWCLWSIKVQMNKGHPSGGGQNDLYKIP